MKEMGEMEPIVKKYQEYKKANEDLDFAKEMVENESDEEMRSLAKAEITEQEDKIEVLAEELKVLLIPKDPNDERNVILEIRAGTGGDEAALFGGDLLRMVMARDFGVKMQFGGNDQWSNIIGGVDLTRKMCNKDVYGMLQRRQNLNWNLTHQKNFHMD